MCVCTCTCVHRIISIATCCVCMSTNTMYIHVIELHFVQYYNHAAEKSQNEGSPCVLLCTLCMLELHVLKSPCNRYLPMCTIFYGKWGFIQKCSQGVGVGERGEGVIKDFQGQVAYMYICLLFRRACDYSTYTKILKVLGGGG